MSSFNANFHDSLRDMANNDFPNYLKDQSYTPLTTYDDYQKYSKDLIPEPARRYFEKIYGPEVTPSFNFNVEGKNTCILENPNTPKNRWVIGFWKKVSPKYPPYFDYIHYNNYKALVAFRAVKKVLEVNVHGIFYKTKTGAKEFMVIESGLTVNATKLSFYAVQKDLKDSHFTGSIGVLTERDNYGNDTFKYIPSAVFSPFNDIKFIFPNSEGIYPESISVILQNDLEYILDVRNGWQQNGSNLLQGDHFLKTSFIEQRKQEDREFAVFLARYGQLPPPQEVQAIVVTNSSSESSTNDGS